MRLTSRDLLSCAILLTIYIVEEVYMAGTNRPRTPTTIITTPSSRSTTPEPPSSTSSSRTPSSSTTEDPAIVAERKTVKALSEYYDAQARFHNDMKQAYKIWTSPELEKVLPLTVRVKLNYFLAPYKQLGDVNPFPGHKVTQVPDAVANIDSQVRSPEFASSLNAMRVAIENYEQFNKFIADELNTIDALKTNKAFKECCLQDPIKPVQHIMRYPMLVAEIKRDVKDTKNNAYTPTLHVLEKTYDDLIARTTAVNTQMKANDTKKIDAEVNADLMNLVSGRVRSLSDTPVSPSPSKGNDAVFSHIAKILEDNIRRLYTISQQTHHQEQQPAIDSFTSDLARLRVKILNVDNNLNLDERLKAVELITGKFEMAKRAGVPAIADVIENYNNTQKKVVEESRLRVQTSAAYADQLKTSRRTTAEKMKAATPSDSPYSRIEKAFREFITDVEKFSKQSTGIMGRYGSTAKRHTIAEALYKQIQKTLDDAKTQPPAEQVKAVEQALLKVQEGWKAFYPNIEWKDMLKMEARRSDRSSEKKQGEVSIKQVYHNFKSLHEQRIGDALKVMRAQVPGISTAPPKTAR